MVIEFNKIFSSTLPRPDAKFFWCFKNWFHPYLQDVVGGLVEPNFIEFCSRESFKIYSNWLFAAGLLLAAKVKEPVQK